MNPTKTKHMKDIEQDQKKLGLHLSYDESIDWYEFLSAERLAHMQLRHMVKLLGDPRSRILAEELKRREQFLRNFR